ncbi:hypothetical protein Dvina_40640 [Dactylosporangium vinaceum]|uniref:SMODS and SLOG-associating 2TM effector domain-containing protein n=1 Tax=Dactylosporangium vinaceum TaxID=53362 RepID=A0ABV5M3J7_9ACTN|nr:hypothetical protein [Dactylosporangium vinaceum]UAB94401.1 hypothetical protein Dvina_40640 [Dactylosporangium vinaceum]
MTYEMLRRHAEDMRRVAVAVAMGGRPEGDRALVEREFADLPDAFRPLLDLPDPARYQGKIDRIDSVLSGLSTGGDGHRANPQLRDLTGALRNWTGPAAERFRDGFLEPWPAYIRNQYTVGLVLRQALEAQREIWVRARQDADQIGEQGLGAMRASGDCTRTEWTITFTVLASVAAVAAVPLTGGLALAAGGVAGLAQIAAATGPQDAPQTTFSADDPVEVAERVREAVTRLRAGIHERWEATAQALRTTGQTVRDRPELFGWQ